jgi:hypothetical protein
VAGATEHAAIMTESKPHAGTARNRFVIGSTSLLRGAIDDPSRS